MSRPTLSLKKKPAKTTPARVSTRQTDEHAQFKKSLHAARMWLRETLPNEPLAIGIQAELQKRRPVGVSKRALGIALYEWTRRDAYQRLLASGADRVDLDGNRTPINPEHIKHAQQRLEET
jgi:hypothetical protein